MTTHPPRSVSENLPPHSQLVFPMLTAIATAGGRMRPSELYNTLADHFDLTEAERTATAAVSGKNTNLWQRHVRWARQTAVVKGLISKETRGIWELTDHANLKLRNARPGTILTVFETANGVMLWADATDAIGIIEPQSLDLIFSSPPYPLLKPKAYGNLQAREWLDWMLRLCEDWRELLTPTGSLMLNLGTVWNPGLPTTNDYIERLTIALQDNLGLHYCQRLEWLNRTKLPQPMSFVAVQRVRVTPATEPILWFSATPNPKANNRNVLRPYGKRMREILANGHPRAVRPSGSHMREHSFSVDNGGSIPTNVLDVPNAASNDAYHRACRDAGIPAHPATFPPKLAEFCINLTTDRGDRVADFFSGSGTTARVAETLGRRWICGDKSLAYAEASRLRFPGVPSLLRAS